MPDKIFCGSGKKREFQNGGSITKIKVDLNVLQQCFDEYGFNTESGKRLMTLNVSTLRNSPDQYGNTHSVDIDTWKPDPNHGNQSNNHNNQNNNQGGYPGYPGNNGNFEDDIPF